MLGNKGTCKVCIDLITSSTAAVIKISNYEAVFGFIALKQGFQLNVINVLISYFTSMYIS